MSVRKYTFKYLLPIFWGGILILTFGFLLKRYLSQPFEPAQSDVAKKVTFLSNPSSDVSPSPKTPTPRPGFKQYLSPNYNFGFSYPASVFVESFGDKSLQWVTIKDYSIEITPESGYITTADGGRTDLPLKEIMLEKDLLCGVTGVQKQIRCKNNKIEDFFDSAGDHGYKVYRTVITTKYRQITQSYNDVAYVFPLPHKVVMKYIDKEDWEVIILHLIPQTPITELARNKTLLDQIAKSFFYF